LSDRADLARCGPARHSDAAIVLAAGAGLPPMLPDDLVTGTGNFPPPR